MKVTIDASVHLLLSTFALSNEMEEVAAMLLGSTEEDVYITSCVFLVRKDKRKDRVEISSEQLSEAMEKAEKLGLRVIGWMHSHPKITVYPSHVDLKTQLSLQSLDSKFIGIIYSCFERKDDSHRVQLTAFQTDPSGEHLQIPVIVKSAKLNLETLKLLQEIPMVYLKEETDELTAVALQTSALRVVKLEQTLVLPLLEILKTRISCI
ncbi:BRCA1 BRCA2-containing complex, subunit 3 [Boothiomyces sp. JEL0866]|nr:BRCA1 BRCA2-containing complex, subunit 3 [Boothiomyces sp. JEL0866]